MSLVCRHKPRVAKSVGNPRPLLLSWLHLPPCIWGSQPSQPGLTALKGVSLVLWQLGAWCHCWLWNVPKVCTWKAVVLSTSTAARRIQAQCPYTLYACLSLLQGILPTQGSNPGFPHCRQMTIWATREARIWAPQPEIIIPAAPGVGEGFGDQSSGHLWIHRPSERSDLDGGSCPHSGCSCCISLQGLHKKKKREVLLPLGLHI